MQKTTLEPCDIGKIIKENIKKENSVFIFSTELCTSSWAEWCVKNPALSGVKAVGLEHFMAWDSFKREYVVAKDASKHAVPSVLRKIFVNDLLYQNAKAAKEGKELLFKSIISGEYAEDGYSFAAWLSSNLSSLKLWHDRFEPWSQQNPDQIDAEDSDYLLLFNKYKEFLGNEMFEPSWIGAEFNDTAKEFFIFYPEQFNDFDEYDSLLTQSQSVHLYVLPEESKLPLKVHCYSDARKELRRTALYLRDLNSKGVSYNDIALHVPELEVYEPYLKRELKNYCIPFVLRAGQKVTVNNAGSIFEDFNNCINNNFDYDSVRACLMNTYIPWQSPEINENLVRIGQELHIICNYSNQKEEDQWIKALKKTSSTNELELRLYKKFRDYVESMCKAESFKDIQQMWFAFKNEFLQKDGFNQSADNVLSRCIKCLNDLIQIENDYVIPRGLVINNHFEFFLNELRDIQYTTQEKLIGVNIFDYKVAASSAFKYNVVLNCAQNAVNIGFKKLGFLTSQKREKLGIHDNDKVSLAYLRLYSKFNTETESPTIYSFSEKSLNGFAIPHNSLKKMSEEPFAELDKMDFIKNEGKWFLYGCKKDCSVPQELSDKQIEQFKLWKERFESKSDAAGDNCRIWELAKASLSSRKIKGVGEDVLKITQKDMSDFFPCPRKWIFSDVLKLKDDTLDAVLFNYFDQGVINHKILELLFNEFKVLPVASESDGSFGEQEALVYDKINACADKAIHSSDMPFKDSPIVITVLESQKSTFVDIITNFLRDFCRPQDASSNPGYGGCKVVSTESWNGIKYDDYALCGKIDCILVNDEDQIVIVDYKNNSVPAINDCIVDETTGLLENFQCAMYVDLWNIGHDSVRVSRMTFRSITNTLPSGKKIIISENKTSSRDKSVTPEEFETTLELFHEYTDTMYDSVSKGSLEPSFKAEEAKLKVDAYANCRSCAFKSICRTSFTVTGKKN